MELTVLGSGTAIPLKERSSPSLALVVEGDLTVFDMGPGSLRQLAMADLDYEALSRVFITHFHPDHTADLVHLLFSSRNPAVMARRRPFVVSGPPGLRNLIGALEQAYNGWLTLPPGLMEIEELNPHTTRKRRYESFTLRWVPVRHTPHSLAYRVTARNGKSIVYSGDTGFCREMVGIASGADLLVLEASFPDGREVEGHLTPSKAGRIAAEAGVHRLLLTHFYPECLATDIRAQCRRTFTGELVLAADLLRLNV